MLMSLSIRDLAVIESVEIDFEQGFTALTGETGAGKSILVDALTLVLGGRASSDLVRTGAESAEVEALFDVSGLAAAREFLAAEDEEPPAEAVIRRVVNRQGRSKAWLNGRLESQSRLFELGRFLVDIYGQHEYQSLLREDRHGPLLDGFGALAEMAGEYGGAYKRYRALLSERKSLDLDETRRREREDLLRFRVREIESAGLSAGEEDGLRKTREQLKHAELLISAGSFGVETLYESDGSVAERLREVEGRIEEASLHDEWFSGPLEQVRQAAALVEDAALDIRGHVDGIEADPSRLEEVEERLELIKKMKRKYGQEIDDILVILEEARAELDALLGRDKRLESLEQDLAAAEHSVRTLAKKLSMARKKAAAELARRVESELSGLGMEKTRFEARIEPCDFGPRGADRVSFYLSPNPGEDLKPLSKIASGGELSRIMLALRVILSGEGGVSSLVFDEVDQGVGGAVAEAVGQRMKRLAAGHQVLCVTHLPQIAALADAHFLIRKRQDPKRTWTEVEKVSGEARVEEVSRMLAGRDITETARAHARELIALGRPAPGRGKGNAKRT